MPTAHTFVGFAFASADLLLEIEPDGRIGFALGAGETITGLADHAIAGRDWRALVCEDDRPMVEALFTGLGGGARAGPVVIAVDTPAGSPPRFASLTAIRLPQNKGAISCTLSQAASRGAAGLQDREAFEIRAGDLIAASAQELELAFVELAGVSSSGAMDAKALEALIGGVLRAQSYQGEAATPVGPDRYALIRGRDEPTEVMAKRIAQVLSSNGVTGVEPQTAAVALTGVTRPKQVMQALRYALSQVEREGLGGAPGDLAAALDCAMRSILGKAGELGDAISKRMFRLVYQPVVGLRDRALHHHEVLVRFGPDGSPFPTIRIAEELELIEALDIAVLEETLKVMDRDPEASLAVNASGRSLVSESFVNRACALIKARPGVQGRLLFEITESAAVDDLVVAERHIRTLKAAGAVICLDDFGAGAASFAYVQQLTLDMLKIDGAYIRDLQHGGREATFVKHLVNMCRELRIRTVAEMVETVEAEEAVRKAGVDFAQGWLYGRPAEAPHDRRTYRARGAIPEGALAVRSALDR